LESLESTFNQDLNGDSITGLSTTLIHNDGSTDLTAVANRFFLYDHTSGTGPSLKIGGMDVVAGQFGTWSPFDAVQTASGYDIAWRNGAGQYIVWSTDRNGNFTSNLIPVVPGTSIALEQLEYTFNQDLNGDTLIGIPSSAGSGSAGSVFTTVMTPVSAGTLVISVKPSSGTDTLGTITTLGSLTNNGTISGTDTLGNGASVPNLALLAQYVATSFAGASNVHDGAPVTEQAPNPPPLLTSPHT
jgi:hypothetical protein